MEVSRDAAWELFCEWTQSDSLRKHVLGVEAAMVYYAREFGEDEELWAATGILHDLDYERYPDLETGHPRMALALFEQILCGPGLECRGQHGIERVSALLGGCVYDGSPATLQGFFEQRRQNAFKRHILQMIE